MDGAVVAVVGSCNTDLTVFTDKLPSPGETVMGSDAVIAGGGKGANQAVAAARAGADVHFVARVGTDHFSKHRLADLKNEGIGDGYITIDPEAVGGLALITVDAEGENAITVASGANGHLKPDQVMDAREAVQSADVLLAQLEIPVESVEKALELAREAGVTTIVDPAPALSSELAGRLIPKSDILTPNLSEARLLLDRGRRGEPEELAHSLVAAGLDTVALTLGKDGVCVATPEDCYRVPAPETDAVDSVGAGDCFAAVLAVALAEGKKVRDAVEMAATAAAISVERQGAQPSLPRRTEIEDRMRL